MSVLVHRFTENSTKDPEWQKTASKDELSDFSEIKLGTNRQLAHNSVEIMKLSSQLEQWPKRENERRLRERHQNRFEHECAASRKMSNKMSEERSREVSSIFESHLIDKLVDFQDIWETSRKQMAELEGRRTTKDNEKTTTPKAETMTMAMTEEAPIDGDKEGLGH